MDKETQMSLREIINYLYSDEERHWMEVDEPTAGHIFHDIKKVADWLDTVAPQ